MSSKGSFVFTITDSQITYFSFLYSLCLPIVVIPILKLSHSSSIMSETFVTGMAGQLISWAISWIVIGFNIYLLKMFLDDFGWLFWLAGPSIAYLILVGYLIYVPLTPDPSAEDPKSIQPVI